MNNITESYPFCYAMKNGNKINLYVLVKVPTGKIIDFPLLTETDFTGETKFFEIILSDAGNGPDNAGNKYEKYEFDAIEDGESIDTLEVYTLLGTGGARIKTMKIEVSDLDVVSGVLS